MNSQDNRESSNGMLTRSIAWFALGLGAAELLAPKQVARLIGVRPSGWVGRVMRMLGAREALTGLGILSGRGTPGWLAGRVAGDALDVGLLVTELGTSKGFLGKGPGRTRLLVAMGAVAGVSALDLIALREQLRRSRRERSTRPMLTASITIDRQPSDVYSFWRDVENLPRFMSYLVSVRSSDRIHSHWQVRIPGGKRLEWEATIVDDRPSQRIAWKVEPSVLGRMIDSGEVRFEAAPGGRGTEVHLALWGSEMHTPEAINRWLRKMPEAFFTTQLRRLKQLLELGEITLSDASIHEGKHPARPSRQTRLTSEAQALPSFSAGTFENVPPAPEKGVVS